MALTFALNRIIIQAVQNLTTNSGKAHVVGVADSPDLPLVNAFDTTYRFKIKSTARAVASSMPR